MIYRIKMQTIMKEHYDPDAQNMMSFCKAGDMLELSMAMKNYVSSANW